ncbi:MAG TPA: trehalose-phosphatase [Aggregatilineales bacterium]|nr:trehalose-phosphatase [Aggregatilineales bacterium]HQA68297.1 trehalose-phosphatase [Aggregatilineales bacterium]
MLWQDATDILRSLVQTPQFGLITDVDGTISPIVPDPDEARVTAQNRRLLEELGKLLPLVAVISGRAAADVQARVGLPHVLYVGNHGFERWVTERAEAEVVPEVAIFRPALEEAIRALRPLLIPGMRLEDKAWTLSLHYRQTADPPTVAMEFRPLVERIAGECGLVLYEGRMVFELRPPVKVNKGTAVRAMVRNYKLDAALFLGDDMTDVDAFVALRELREQNLCRAYGVGVLSVATPEPVLDNSDFVVDGVVGVETLFGWLLNARKASST